MSRSRVTAISTAVALPLLAGATFAATPAITNAGTLTCTVAKVPDDPKSSIDLSCNFKGQDGTTSDYEGAAARQAGAFPPGKHVFVWSVVVLADVKAPLLDGTFRGETGGQGSPVLLGGKDDSVRLEPVTGTAQIDAVKAPTVLTLKLAATKT